MKNETSGGCLVVNSRSWEGFSFSTIPPCDYLLSAVATSTAQATLNLPLGCYRCQGIPSSQRVPEPTTNREQSKLACFVEVRRRKSPQGLTDEEPANCASECIRPIVSVTRPNLKFTIDRLIILCLPSACKPLLYQRKTTPSQ